MRGLILALLCLNAVAFSQQPHAFLGVYSGSIKPYLKDVAPLLRVKKVVGTTVYSVFLGALYIFKTYENYANAIVKAEEQASKKFEEYSKKACSQYKYSLVDHFTVQVVNIEKEGLLLVFTGNVMCLE